MDPLTTESRINIIPIKYQKLYDMGSQLVATTWSADANTNFTKDKEDYEQFPEKNRDLIRIPLAFFAKADELILENIQDNFASKVVVPEVKAFYNFKSANEAIHNIAYGLQISGIFKDEKERQMLFDGLNTIPIVKKMGAFAARYFKAEQPLATRMIASICIESLFFEPAFTIIAFLGTKRLFHQIDKFNQWISRDEAVHVAFDVEVYNTLIANKLSMAALTAIITEATEIAQEFADAILQNPYKEFDKESFRAHIRYRANTLCKNLNVKFIYPELKTPLEFMKTYIGAPSVNFFETDSTNYNIVAIADTIKHTDDF